MTEQSRPHEPIASNSGEGEELTIVFRPTMSELIHTTAAMNRGGIFANGFGGFSAAAVVLLLWAGAPPSVVLLPALFTVLLLSGYFATPFIWFIATRRRDLMLAPTTMTLNDEGIAFENATMSGRHDWSVYRRARDLGSGLMLEAGPGIAALIPKSAITDRAALVGILARHGLIREPTTWERARPFVWLLVGAAAFIVQAIAQGTLRLG